VFTARGQPLTRFGIYKIVRRHAASLDDPRTGRKVSPHTFRHYVDGRVMWPEAASPLVAESRGLVPAT
jgi:integrase